MDREARRGRLEMLAVGLCQDAGIRVEVASGCWAYDPVRRVIRVSDEDLDNRGAEFCVGILAHEVGHYFISRYVRLHVSFPSERASRLVLNSIEDPRVEAWVRRRYPGAGAWLEAANRVLLGRLVQPLLPWVLEFCVAAALEPLLGWTPLPPSHDLPAAVRQALDRTRPARRRYADTVPPPAMRPGDFAPDTAARFDGEVLPALETAPAMTPHPVEKGILVSAVDALRLAEAEILPEAERLWEADVRRVQSILAADRRLVRKAREALAAGDGGIPAAIVALSVRAADDADRPAPAGLRPLAVRVLETFLSGPSAPQAPLLVEGCPPAAREPLAAPPPADVGAGSVSPPPHVRRAVRNDYERALARVAGGIDRLARVLEMVLRPRRRLRERAGYPTGHRVDLRRLVACEADPRRHAEIWARKTVPDRRRVAFSLLVDLSASMRGEKVQAALCGTVLLVETLARLEVPFAVNGFQDEIIPFWAPGERLTPSARARIGLMPLEVQGSRPGGHNMPGSNDDGPCLLAASREILAYPATDRVLIVVSDGQPAGRHSDADDLRAAVAALTARRCGLDLIGVGIGPDTEHVGLFYPAAIAGVPVDRLAEEIGGLLERVLLGPGARRGP
jgi:hypothetical protein